MRYNSDNDKFEVYYNGKWHPALSANIQTVYLYNEGEEVVPLDFKGYTINSNYTAKAPTRGDDYILLSISATEQECAVCSNEVYDLTNYTKVKALVTWNGVDYTISTDVTDISSGYVIVTLRQRNGSSNLGVYVSSAKATYQNGQLAQSIEAFQTESAVYRNANVKAIWVE